MPSGAQDVCCSEILKVLANETRLRVVQQLLDGPKNVGQINEQLKIEPTLLSHHLKTLRNRKIVVTERDGKTINYRLAPNVALARRGVGLDLGCCQLVFLDK